MEFAIFYTFNKIGHYEVYLTLIDDIGAEWYAECYWDVSDTFDTTLTNQTSTSDSSQELTDQLSPWFELFLIPVTIGVLVYFRKRH